MGISCQKELIPTRAAVSTGMVPSGWTPSLSPSCGPACKTDETGASPWGQGTTDSWTPLPTQGLSASSEGNHFSPTTHAGVRRLVAPPTPAPVFIEEGSKAQGTWESLSVWEVGVNKRTGELRAEQDGAEAESGP